MVKTNKSITLSIWLSLFVSLSVFGQQEERLINILKSLETKHSVQFNYAEDVISDVQIFPPSASLSLKSTLDYLESTTGLNFKRLRSNFILVTKPEDLLFCGYLIDEEDRFPIAFASIQSHENAATSDDNGFFQLKIDKVSDTITIRHIGYKTINKSYIELRTLKCDSLKLSAKIEALSEILLSNYITSGINKLKGGTFEIDASKFGILPGLIDTDILQAVQAFPGIQSVNETVSNINIRGGTHDQNLILWDGIKMYQSGHFFGLISMYNPQITQNVSLQKNGSDVSLTDGVSGTIAMKTNQNINSVFKGSIGANFTDVNGFADVPIGKKSSLQLAARKSISDIVETPTYHQFFERIAQDTEVNANENNVVNSNQEFDFYDLSLRWLYQISLKDKLRLNFITVANDLMFNESAEVNTIERSKQSMLSQNSIAGAVEYDRTWNDKWQSTLSVYETDYKLQAINANVLDAQRFLQENSVSETSIKLKTNYKLKPNLNWQNGYQFVETKVTNLDDVDVPLFRSLVSEVVRTHALFSQFNWASKNKNTQFNVGLRYNYIDKFKKSIIEPRLAFNHSFNDKVSVEFLGEFKHQNTSQIINFQNDFLGIEKRRWQLSNDQDIPVIRSRQFSSGLHYDHKQWLFSLEGFYKSVKGITSQSQGFQNQFEFIKTNGNYNAYGFDVLLSKRFKKINSWLSYTYLDAQYEFNALQTQNFPSNLDVRHTITFGTTYTTNRLKISTGLHWHSGNPTTKINQAEPVINNEVNFLEPNRNNLNSYLRLDASLIYNMKLGAKTKARLGVSVWNLLNRNNNINKFYNLSNGLVNETVQSSLSLTPNVSFRVYF